MGKKNEYFQLGFSQYLHLLEIAVLKPDIYASYLKSFSLTQGLIFFTINASLWLILSALIRAFLIERYRLFFGILSETLILVIPILIALFLLAIILFIFAKIFGSRTKFKNNLKAVFYSTILLPFLAVPVFKVLAAIISLFILIYCFKTVNRFDRLKATVSVVIPIGIFVFVLYSIGVLNINLIIR